MEGGKRGLRLKDSVKDHSMVTIARAFVVVPSQVRGRRLVNKEMKRLQMRDVDMIQCTEYGEE